MAKPPADTPHSDIDGVNKDARVNTPNRNQDLGSSEEAGNAEAESTGRPERSNERN